MATLIKSYIRRTAKCTFGLFLFGLGVHLMIQAKIGLAPWDAFSYGFTNITGLSFGVIVILSGFIILGIDLALKEKIGVGTILNTILIGVFVDVLNAIGIIPENTSGNLLIGIPMLLAGQWIICFASIFYITPGLGCGPRDSLMVALGKRFTKVPIGVVRGCIEAAALLIGFLLGGPVGIGTVITVFGLGILLQLTLRMTKVNLKDIEHESIIKTWQVLTGRKPVLEAEEPCGQAECAEED